MLRPFLTHSSNRQKHERRKVLFCFTTSHNVDRFQQRSDCREAFQLLRRLTMVDKVRTGSFVNPRPIYTVVSVQQEFSISQSYSWSNEKMKMLMIFKETRPRWRQRQAFPNEFITESKNHLESANYEDFPVGRKNENPREQLTQQPSYNVLAFNPRVICVSIYLNSCWYV